MKYETKTFEIENVSDAALHAATNYDSIVERMKADIAYHAGEAERITRDVLDIDTAPEGAYNAEDDAAESYHTGRVEAMSNALDMLLGREVTLYSETQ